MLFAKENPVRSEKYRRAVAALECAHCGVWGRSQAAHPPPTGKGIKESDLECVPLCSVWPSGLEGCHILADTYRIKPKGELRPWMLELAKETRAKIFAAGMWPRGLELYD